MILINTLDKALKEANKVYKPEYQLDIGLIIELLECNENKILTAGMIDEIFRLGFLQGYKAKDSEINETKE